MAAKIPTRLDACPGPGRPTKAVKMTSRAHRPFARGFAKRGPGAQKIA